MYNRLLYRLIDKRNSPERIIILTISIIVAIAVGVFVFIKLDRTPAIPEDYEELHRQLLMVENNPEEFMKHKGQISIYDDEIIYEIENKECEMKGRYTLDYQLIDYTPKDKAASWFWTIFCVVGMGIIFWFISAIVIWFIIFVVESIVITIILLVRKIKK